MFYSTLSDLTFALDYNFGAEWRALTTDEQVLIIRDCTEEGGVEDIQQYRRRIGRGNLASYVKVQAVRFTRKDRS